MKTKFLSGIVILLALALTACPPKNSPKKPATTANQPPSIDESGAMDFQAFLGRLRKAAQAHDVNAVAAMMTPDFGYRLDPVASGPGVFQYWDENNLWVELNGILAERFVPNGAYMVAPPQFVDTTAAYTGYRAGIRRVNGSWKFAYFVNG